MFAALILAFVGLVQAADHELSLEAGRLGATTSAWNSFSDANRLGGLGLRVGYAPTERVQVFAAWQRHRRGQRYEYGYDYDYDSEEWATSGPGADQGFRSAFYGQQVGLGARFDLALNPYFQPYAVAQGLLQVGTVRLDDDDDSLENPNQLTQRAFAPGFAAGLGGDLKLAPPEWPVRPNVRLELGYGRTMPLDFADMGELQFSGFYGRIAAGITF